MVTGIDLLRTKLVQEIEAGVGFVLTSNEDFGEVSVFDLEYAILENLGIIVNLGIKTLSSNAINTSTFSCHWTPVHVAVMTGHDVALQKLIEAGARLDVRDNRSMTPLHYAALLGRTKQITTLLYAGASSDIECATGGTFLDILRCVDPPSSSRIPPLNLLNRKWTQKLT
jgi:hypothetical protein